MFHYALVVEVRRKNSFRQGEFAELLGISGSYLARIEKGSQEPSIAVIESLVRVTGIPVGEWLLTTGPEADAEDFSAYPASSAQMGSHARTVAELKSRLNHEHRARRAAEERIWELERANECLLAENRLRDHYERIVCAGSLSKGEKAEKLKILAAYTLEEDILCFDDVQRILKIGRPTLRNWLDVQRREFVCRYADGGKIMASSPGEAGLCLRCFDCRAFESGECLGHGDEKRPETILGLLEKLRENGVYDCSEQAQILEKYYSVTMSARKIADIRYRARNHLSIPEDLLYLDIRRD